jgi:hypothetical protein
MSSQGHSAEEQQARFGKPTAKKPVVKKNVVKLTPSNHHPDHISNSAEPSTGSVRLAPPSPKTRPIPAFGKKGREKGGYKGKGKQALKGNKSGKTFNPSKGNMDWDVAACTSGKGEPWGAISVQQSSTEFQAAIAEAYAAADQDAVDYLMDAARHVRETLAEVPGHEIFHNTAPKLGRTLSLSATGVHAMRCWSCGDHANWREMELYWRPYYRQHSSYCRHCMFCWRAEVNNPW